jgi:hypothetical protein
MAEFMPTKVIHKKTEKISGLRYHRPVDGENVATCGKVLAA